MDEAKHREIVQWLIKAQHDLVLLSDLCQSWDTSFQNLAESAEILTPYATLFRYPGECMMPAEPDALEAVDAATLVLNFVIEKMPDEARPTLAQ